MSIHKTAIVSKKAKLADKIEVGPFTIIGDNVKIGKNCQIASHCVIDGNTTIGEGNKIFHGAIVGSPPQDLKYKGEKSLLEIGNNNIIREYTTINPGTSTGSKTKIASNNLFMAYSHVAHDCIVGNDCIVANVGTLAGHVTVEDGVVIGGLAAVHQFCRVGKMSIVGGCSKAVQDIPPFSTCDGHPAEIYSLNLIGLRRKKISNESITDLKKAYKILFFSGLITSHAVEKVLKELPSSEEVKYLIDFIKNSKRGLCHSIKSHQTSELV